MDPAGFNHLLGASAALLSALSWAISALIFAKLSHSISALSMNWFKGVVAITCLLVLVFPLNLMQISFYQWIFLLLSGLLGIAIGDTLYFHTLKHLGARLTLLLSTLIPLVTALGAIVIFNERLSLFAAIGLMITLCSVFAVLWSKAEKQNKQDKLSVGVVVGLVFVTTEASAILLTKAAVLELDSLLVTFIRQVVGVAGITLWLLATQQMRTTVSVIATQKSHIFSLITAAIIGGFIGTWLSVYALKATYASAAVILNSTSPLFVIPLTIWFMRESVPKSSIYGTFVALVGIIIYFVQI